MINGEGTRENSSDAASPDLFDELPPWMDQNLEAASPASSEYSSCGESEFERYCSANSVMGTTSLCSSLGTCNEFLDSDSGSTRSLGHGEDRLLESFGFGGRFGRNSRDRGCASLGDFDCLPDGSIEICKGKMGIENGVSVEGKVLSRNKNQSKSLLTYQEGATEVGDFCSEVKNENLAMLKVGSASKSLRNLGADASSNTGTSNGNNSEGLVLSNGPSEVGSLQSFAENNTSKQIISVENNENLNKFRIVNESHSLLGSSEEISSYPSPCEDNSTEQIHTDMDHFHSLTSAFDVPIDEREIDRLPEEEDTSSRYEPSEDDSSMLDSGTDDEQSASCRRNLQFRQETKTENENPLLMNSAVAFGSDDWDDFTQEMNLMNEINLVPLLPDRPQEQLHQETEGNLLNSTFLGDIGSPIFGRSQIEESVRDIAMASHQVEDMHESTGYAKCKSSTPARNVLTSEKDLPLQKAPIETGSTLMDDGAERNLQCINSGEVSSHDEVGISESVSVEKSKIQLQLAPLSDASVSKLCSTENEAPQGKEAGFLEDQLDLLFDVSYNQLCSSSTEAPQEKDAGILEDHEPNAHSPMVDINQETCLNRILADSSISKDQVEDHLTSVEVGHLESNESYDEVVLEMEEILLDSGESPGRRFTSRSPQSFRDGSSTASTSGTNFAYPLIQNPLKIDAIEVIGAKQKKGEVSLGERLVGVKEYTVYQLRVWSGKDQWEVERRYRDFYTLYRQLKTLFTDQGWSLPEPWSYVERESRKIFGNASPSVISERSTLIQECLRSVLHYGFSSSTLGPLIWFLSPQKSLPSSPLNSPVLQKTSFTRDTSTERFSTLGKTISLLVENMPRKSMKQLLEAQHYTCAGCHRYFDDGKNLLREFVQTLGWGKPRLCEYTGQLFCASCHTNETAVLPAKVLHFWDFTQYPVSQFAKSYLESIYDQPMLCVSAVNPFLFSKVPALLHIMGIRKKIAAMLPYVHCPFQRSIHRGLGSRRYLVESNDFFALRDLVDLSKGAFAALPVIVECVSNKILEHITEQCLICCDAGVPCGAQQACQDPSSLIFPFQEGEIERCSSCETAFHKVCFKKLKRCRCGAYLEMDKGVEPLETMQHGTSDELDGALDLSARKSGPTSPIGLLSGLFSKAKQEKAWSPKNSNPVILMGSLPSTSL
uniref:PX domain-containing protein n=1 Tax=Nelumbo nucifera TaxID=4432 RepID=A0A822YFF5_NELNU|nr:TPA_asm: hypothetical protein HUJ06_009744 [Nelumbo nucifera]